MLSGGAGAGEAWMIRGLPPGKKPWITREGEPGRCGWIGPGEEVTGIEPLPVGARSPAIPPPTARSASMRKALRPTRLTTADFPRQGNDDRRCLDHSTTISTSDRGIQPTSMGGQETSLRPVQPWRFSALSKVNRKVFCGPPESVSLAIRLMLLSTFSGLLWASGYEILTM